MRFTLAPIALALVCLSAPLSGAFARTTTTADEMLYACDEPILTRNWYALLQRGDAESKFQMHQWAIDHRKLSRRVCRYFAPGPVEVVMDDEGDGYTCIDQAKGRDPTDKYCYWAQSRFLVNHED